MRYSFWDIVVLYCAVLSAVFALLEISTFFLIWILIAKAPHYMMFIPFLTRSYISFQSCNNWGLFAALLCVFVSTVRLIISHRAMRIVEEGGGDSAPQLKRRKTLLLISCVAVLLGILRIIAWNHWPFIYW